MQAARQIQPEEILSLFVVDATQQGHGLDDYLLEVLKRCSEWFHTSGASIFIEAEEPRQYILAAKHGSGVKTPDGATISFGKGIAGAAMEQGTPVIVTDPGIEGVKKRKDIGSSLIVPLIEWRSDISTTSPETHCVGVLNLARSVDEPIFDANDLHLAETIGRQIALAVGNAKLFSESKHLGDTLRTVLSHIGFGLISVSGEDRITHINSEAVLTLDKIPTNFQTIFDYCNSLQPHFAESIREVITEARCGEKARKRLYVEGRTWVFTATELPSKGCIVVLQDVTEIEGAQREFERVRRLAEVGQMTASIAHEIRNPLTGIRSAAKMIQEDASLAAEFAEIIETESVKLSKLCDEFLEFARPLRLELTECTIADLCDRVISLARPQFEEAGVKLLCDYADANKPMQMDLRRIEQVIRNLVINALQATAKGGEVIVQAFGETLVVSDTGSGMDEATVVRLFSPFFTTKPQGTGLGLSTVRKILDAHEARIKVTSVVGQGTRFVIRFNQELNP